MPSLTYAAPFLATKKVAITAESVTEQINGLLTVSLSFISTAPHKAAASRLFYLDAPPPVWPDSIARNDLISRQLYMVSHNYRQEAGLFYIEADYAGGLNRPQGSFSSSAERESPRTVSFNSGLAQFGPVLDPVTGGTFTGISYNFYSYTYAPIVQTVQWIQVAGQNSYSPRPPQRETLYSLLSFSGAKSIDDRPGPPRETPYERDFFIGLIDNTRVEEVTKTSYVTPSVAVITRNYFLA